MNQYKEIDALVRTYKNGQKYPPKQPRAGKRKSGGRNAHHNL